ncbi:MAG: glycosyltransferase involved in cell wall biosynthesis [Alphaproteobacteria bacterium]|jgi:glycosyltransferase involved in cell wall biosynthesis
MNVSHTLLVCTDDTSGKIVKATGQLALALLRRGLKVSILTSAECESALDMASSDIIVYHAPKMKLNLPGHSALSAALKKALKKDSTIDIVHVIGLNTVSQTLARVCEHFKVPSIATVMASDSFKLSKLPFWKRKGYLRYLDSFNHVVVNSQLVLEQANILHLDNVYLIKEGVEVDRFKPVLSKRPVRRELDLPEGSTIVCCMADICPENKQLDVLKICQPLSDIIQVLLIGKVTDVAYMEKIRAELRRTATEPFVIMRDAVNNPEDYLKACDVFMLLGGVEERQSTVLEAQSCGLPVVLEASNSALTLTNGNKTGIVLYPHNTLAKNAVEKLISDPNFRQGRSLYARPFVKKEHGFNDMMNAYTTLYVNL